MPKKISITETSIVFVLVLLISSCASPISPTTSNTSTPTIPSTPIKTPTSEATATFTQTPPPTITFTPAATATYFPEITPAAEGKGNLAGKVLWNNQPVPKAAVWLCEDFSGGCVGTYQYRTNTDENGNYIFANVIPGEYIVAINSFSTGWFIFYFSRDGSKKQKVAAGKNLILDPWNIWKFNLKATTPRVDKVLADAQPTFQWEAYPDAAYYRIDIYDINFKPFVTGQRVDGVEFIPNAPLLTCRYYWEVYAYTADDIIIASTLPGAMYFYVIDVPGQC